MVWTLLSAAALAAWAWLFAARGAFWRTRPRLDAAADAAAPPDRWPAVAAVIPARNEAATIARALASITAQDYPGALSVVVVDDGSEDGTAERARTAAAGDGRVSVIAAAPLARGWAGKVWALSQGLAHIDAADRDVSYVWLSDADIEHAPDMLRALVCEAEAHALDLMSLMVLLRVRSFWEKLLIPPFVLFFLKLFPFAWVNVPRARIAAAAGGCVLPRKTALTRIGGIAAIRSALIDDVALARAVKPGGAIRLALSRGSRSLRPYPRLADIWAMVARSAFDQLGHSSLALGAAVPAMVLVYLVPPAAGLAYPLHASFPAAILGALGWAAMVVAAGPINRLYGIARAGGLALPAAAALFVAMTVDSARLHWSGRGAAWKARTYAPARPDGR